MQHVFSREKESVWFVTIFVCLGWIVSVCLHEFGHAVVAYFGGDTSVKDKGYLTLNPLKYTDPGLSLLLPILFLLLGGIALPGGAVYIDRSRLRSRSWESAVSAAGPFASALVTWLLAIPFWLGLVSVETQHWIVPSLAFLILLEIVAVLLNLLPMPPLDGYGIIEPWLPQKTQIQLNKFGRYGIWVIFGLLWFVQPLSRFLWESAHTISEILGVPPEMAWVGYGLFRQQSGFLVLGFVVVAWLFRSKENEWYRRGNKLLKSQKYEEALAAYNQALEIKSDYYQAWYYRSYVLYVLQRHEEALDSYEEVIKLNDKDANAWYYKGLIIANLRRHEEAIACYNQAIEIEPNIESCWFHRGDSLYQLQRYEDAIASYDRVTEINPDYPEAWYNKACCYALQTNIDLAIENLQQAIKLEPQRFIKSAKTDCDFETIQENQLFKNLIG
ncbi:MAG: tetratricopeptide repeat protein [Symploca sp. SIO2C1]|nr:tetratricopeptide repeat protein [Symploca sp. SIO2C1]